MIALEREGPEAAEVDKLAGPLLQAWKDRMVGYPEPDAQAVGHALLSVINMAIEQGAQWDELAFGLAYASGQVIVSMDPTPDPEQARGYLGNIAQRAMRVIHDIVMAMAASGDGRRLDS